MKTWHRVRGFTLIELMIVVSLIGILASVAIPEFTRLTLRARTGERREIMGGIYRCMTDLVLSQGKIPGDVVSGDWNPVGTPTAVKRSMDLTQSGWQQLALGIEGKVYYQYRFVATSLVIPHTLTIVAQGDLDGDGAYSVKQIQYEGFAQSLDQDSTVIPLTENPPEGQEDTATF